MKSAYGLKIPEPDPELTHVGPGMTKKHQNAKA